MYLGFLITLFSLVVHFIAAQQQPNGNQTILQALNDTNASPALKFVALLQSSPDYQPIVDLLSDPSSNVTLFVPSDQVYYNATGQMPTTNNTDMQNSTTGGNTDSSGFSPTGAVGVFFSSIIYGGQSSATSNAEQQQPPTSVTSAGATNAGAAPVATSTQNDDAAATALRSVFSPFFPAPTSLPNMAKYVRMSNEEYLQPYHDSMYSFKPVSLQAALPDNDTSGWNQVIANTPFADQFNLIDLLSYHVVNGTTQFQNSTNILNTLLSNNSIDKLGYGLPLIVQQQQQQQQQQQYQVYHKRQEMTNNTSSDSIWTVGNGLDNSAHIMMNQTIQASNGIVYVVDKILVPPLSPNDTLSALQNVSSFDALLGQLSNNSLDSTTNVTLFVPVNEVLQNLNATGLDAQTLDTIVQAHIVPGVYYTTNLTLQPTTVSTIAGTNITLTNADPSNNISVQVNGTNVVHANILLNNGVMHLIDGVLNYTTNQAQGNSTNGNSTDSSGNNGGSNNDGSNNNDPNNNPFPPSAGSFANKNFIVYISNILVYMTLVIFSYILF
ncbi:hypothetical protein CU098_007729 [Rhizopus stolonifer]|uniref:FAS1 domain-containing protein n=1 Tax=Rhizopus stolonifer TaxID=4846 RepID=A0A367JZU1_RHIST|nr:hypothetical protein CU098_007729 [Rhizopus stolonifer]